MPAPLSLPCSMRMTISSLLPYEIRTSLVLCKTPKASLHQPRPGNLTGEGGIHEKFSELEHVKEALTLLMITLNFDQKLKAHRIGLVLWRTKKASLTQHNLTEEGEIH